MLETLYLMFNEGYSSGGEQLIRHDLCEESIRLARLMADHPSTEAPECDALLALFLLRVGPLGRPRGCRWRPTFAFRPGPPPVGSQ